MAAKQFPASGYISLSTRTEGEIKQALEDWLAATKTLPGGGGAYPTLAISSGAITPTSAVAKVRPEGWVAGDNLDIIHYDNLAVGRLLVLLGPDEDYVVVRHLATSGLGLILTLDGQNVPLYKHNAMVLQNVSGIWYELFRTNIATPHGRQLFTANGTFTAPRGVTKVYLTATGGGGGGGGGAGSGTGAGNGQDGQQGTMATFAGQMICYGSWPGLGGQAGGRGALRNTAGIANSPGGGHASGAFGGIGGTAPNTIFGSSGKGGNGGDGADGTTPGGGGAAGNSTIQAAQPQEFTVTPGSEYAVVVGAGGAGGAGGTAGTGGSAGAAGGAGQNGAVLVEW